MIAKTIGKDVDEATIVPTAMIAVTLGTDAIAGQGKAPGTRGQRGRDAAGRTDKGSGKLEKDRRCRKNSDRKS